MKFTNPDTVLLCGTYLVTDPCYIPALEEVWGAFCDALHAADTGGISVWDSKMPVLSTAYGDGRYPVYKSGVRVGSFGVDSGLYAFVPTELVAVDVADDLVARGLATKVEFPDSTPLKLGDCYGNVLAGDIYIITSGTNEDDDEDLWEDEPDDELWNEATAEDGENYEQRVDSGLIL